MIIDPSNPPMTDIEFEVLYLLAKRLGHDCFVADAETSEAGQELHQCLLCNTVFGQPSEWWRKHLRLHLKESNLLLFA